MYLMIEYATDVAYIDYCSIIYMLYKEGYVMDFLIKVVACFLAGAGAGRGGIGTVCRWLGAVLPQKRS